MSLLRRPPLVLLTLLALLLVPMRPARADPPRWPPEDPRAYESLVRAARVYLDLEQELWVGRKGLLEELLHHAEAGTFQLKDVEGIRWLAQQGRSFLADLRDARWQRASGVTASGSLGGTLYRLASEDLRVTFSLPYARGEAESLQAPFPRPPPLALVLALHEPADVAGTRDAGQACLDRRYPRPAWDALHRTWALLLPVSPDGTWVQDGLVRADALQRPYSIFWKHVPVDFERVVLDGAAEAFPVAAAMPFFFAGVVFRGAWTLADEAQRDVVRNFAPVPVYVVANPALARALRSACHPDVTEGAADARLWTWMQARRRREPRAFSWSARQLDQVLPYWINLDAADWEAPRRAIQVEVVDTDEDPNTIRIGAEGIVSLSLFLNDEIVDLERPVRVVINGHLEHDALLVPTDERVRPLGRDLDLLFNREPTRIRKSMFFGWLRTARIVQLPVRAARTSPEFAGPAPEPPVAAPEVPQAGAPADAPEALRAEGPAREPPVAAPDVPWPAPPPAAEEEAPSTVPWGLLLAILAALLLLALLARRRRR